MGLKKRKKFKKVGKGITKRLAKKTSRKYRIIQSPRKGGFLPFLLPLLDVVGAVGAGASWIAKAVNDAKANTKRLEEQKRHDLAMEQGS